MFRVSVGLLSRGDQPGDDWSDYEFAVDPFGKHVRPPAGLMEALIAQDYEFGTRNNKGGVLKEGFYDVVDFAALFGSDLVTDPLPGV